MNNGTLVILFIMLAAGCYIAVSQDRAPGFHIVDSISLGGETGWDYCLVDTMTNRFYTSRGNWVQVADVKTKQIIGEIANTNGVHGIALVHAANKGYTSNGRDSSLTVFNLETLRPIKTIKIKARNPDAILYEPITKRIFTFSGGSASVTAIDINTDQEIGTVPVGGK
jgi:DNA-binding beta-propeller fold protein YncE